MTQVPWGAHSQIEWKVRARDRRHPMWLRVAAVAYGNHRKNGHAPFPAGHLAEIVDVLDTKTGELKPNQNVSRAIKTAIEYGWLDRDSHAQCLIVPSGAVWGGRIGHELAPCQTCNRRTKSRFIQ